MFVISIITGCVALNCSPGVSVIQQNTQQTHYDGSIIGIRCND